MFANESTPLRIIVIGVVLLLLKSPFKVSGILGATKKTYSPITSKNIDISELFISFSSPVWTRLLYLRLLCVITKDDERVRMFV
jgi:hypothetical protein